MRVFVAGASGAIGTRLFQQLQEAGHDVIGTYRSPEHGERVRALGAEALALDLLDARAVREAVRAAARRDRPRGDRPGRHAVLAATSTAASRPPTGCGSRAPTPCSPPPVGRASSVSRRRSFASARCTRVRAARQDRGRPAGLDAGGGHGRERGGDARPRRGGHRGRRDRAALRRLLRRRQRWPGRAVASGSSRSSATAAVFPVYPPDDAAAATVLAIERGRPGLYNVVDDDPAPGARLAGRPCRVLEADGCASSRAGWRACSPATPR